jgi:hypothetical protein
MDIPGARIHQRRPGRLVVPVNPRLGQAGVLLAAGQHPAQLGRQPLVSYPPEHPRMAAPNSVTVSMVATASYNGVESNTRRTPPAQPAGPPPR